MQKLIVFFAFPKICHIVDFFTHFILICVDYPKNNDKEHAEYLQIQVDLLRTWFISEGLLVVKPNCCEGEACHQAN